MNGYFILIFSGKQLTYFPLWIKFSINSLRKYVFFQKIELLRNFITSSIVYLSLGKVVRTNKRSMWPLRPHQSCTRRPLRVYDLWLRRYATEFVWFAKKICCWKQFLLLDILFNNFVLIYALTWRYISTYPSILHLLTYTFLSNIKKKDSLSHSLSCTVLSLPRLLFTRCPTSVLVEN